MPSPNKNGLSNSQVSDWNTPDNFTPISQTSFFAPYGLKVKHTIVGGTVTGVTGNGTTITYTCRNNFAAGDRVSIIDVIPAVYNLTNVQVATASATQFTVTNSATGTYSSGGNAFTFFQIPTNINWVYVILTGAGGLGTNGGGGGGGGVAWGWTLPQSSCIIGSSGRPGGYTRYGHIIAGGGGNNGAAFLGGGGGNNGGAGSTNYYGIPGGPATLPGAGGGSGNSTSLNGANGISGGAGCNSSTVGVAAGNGGSGIVGGGGAWNSAASGTRVGGNGGNGIGVNGVIYTGGIGATSTTSGAGGGGGAGIAGNGFNASGSSGGQGGLGGGGGGSGGSPGADAEGGSGIVYIYY